MPKICMLIFRYHPIVGGAEMSLRRLSQQLVKSGFEVSVATKLEPGLVAEEVIDGARVYRLKASGGGFKGKFLMLAYTLSVIVFLLKHNKEYDVIHIHGADPYGSVAGFLGKLLGKKVMLKIATGGEYGDISGFKESLLGGLQKALYKKYTDIYICISAQIKDEVITEGFSRDKIREIPNGVDVDEFKPLCAADKMKIRGRLLLPSDARIALFAGRLVVRKGLSELIDSWKIISASYKDCLLLVAGSGSQGDELRKKVRDLQLDSNIIFLGDVNNMCDYYGASDIFVLPSYGEGLPNALLEAMACGLPLAVSEIPGIKEIVEKAGCGVMFRPKDDDSLCKAIIALLYDEKKRQEMGVKGRGFAADNYAIEKIADRYSLLYKEICQKN